MTVYLVAMVTITDKERYDAYQARLPEVFEGCGGRILASDEMPLRLEGATSPDKIVLIQFDNAEQISTFLLSDAYQEISRDREAGSITIAHAVHGLADPML
ncbi:DUF1330 domain-containing protein [Pseudooceanicola sp.]|uniref:DUF1330 domain-containing protein n=1 Tax=Pseudooceanicola sp. TaxID=1914328 RepID=UPI0035C6F187